MKLGDELSKQIYAEIITSIAALQAKGNCVRSPKLGIIQVGDNPASNKYITIKKNRINQLGWEVVHVKLQDDESLFRAQIVRMSEDDSVDGIIVQLPLPKHYNNTFLDLIPYYKDVDGLTTINQGKLFRGADEATYLAPCTAKACIYFLEQNHIQLSGAHVAVLGRSNLVGAPIGVLLQQRGATVLQVNQADTRQAEMTVLCDVLISAIGVPFYITKEYVKPGAFVVDIGLSNLDGILVGDVHDEVQATACVSPSRGGIGPLTVAFLMHNLFQSYLLSRERK